MSEYDEWYAQTWAGQRDALIARCEEVERILIAGVASGNVADEDLGKVTDAIVALQDIASELRLARIAPSLNDINRAFRSISGNDLTIVRQMREN